MNKFAQFQSLEGVVASFATTLLTEAAQAALSNPAEFFDSFDQLFSHHHTGYDACQDILDACEAGHVSEDASLQAIAILLSDMKQRKAVHVESRCV